MDVFADEAGSYCDADGKESEALEERACIVCVAIHLFWADLCAKEFEALFFSEQGELQRLMLAQEGEGIETRGDEY